MWSYGNYETSTLSVQEEELQNGGESEGYIFEDPSGNEASESSEQVHEAFPGDSSDSFRRKRSWYKHGRGL